VESNLQQLPSSKHDKGKDQKFKEKDGKVCFKTTIKGVDGSRPAKESKGMDSQGGIYLFSKYKKKVGK
jgi:hypothetical protein